MAAGARLGGGRKTERFRSDMPCDKPKGRNYHQRTKCTVRDSDGTLIITPTPELTGGLLWTQECARDLSRPYLHVYPCTSWREWIRTFLQTNSIRILNVAGPRSSSAKNIEAFVHEVLDEVFSNADVTD
jgi:hypothetical protein